MNQKNDALIKKLTEYLSNRRIASVFEKSDEKMDLQALKLMCIVDNECEKSVYHKIESYPKMFKQLLKFKSYSNFKYFDCRIDSALNNRILQCFFCEFVAPYALTFTHMAMNHDVHTSLKQCAYCKRSDLSTHISQDTLEACYKRYILKYMVDYISEEQTMGIRRFYEIMKSISIELGVLIDRVSTYNGTGNAKTQNIKIDGFKTTFTTFTPRNSSKTIDPNVLDNIFRSEFQIFYKKSETVTETLTQAAGAESASYEFNLPNSRITRNVTFEPITSNVNQFK